VSGDSRFSLASLRLTITCSTARKQIRDGPGNRAKVGQKICSYKVRGRKINVRGSIRALLWHVEKTVTEGGFSAGSLLDNLQAGLGLNVGTHRVLKATDGSDTVK
jgi:hypothetical protein